LFAEQKCSIKDPDQLSKFFSDKEDLFKVFVKKQDVKYDNKASMVELIKFLEANKNGN